jgi:hypothetical protein
MKRVTYKQLHQEVVRVFGEHTDEPIAWVTGPRIGAGHICGQWRFDVRVEDLERWLDGVEKRHAG